MRIRTISASIGVAVLALVGFAPAAANAASLYEHINYSTWMWTGTTSLPGGLPAGYNDKASSVTNSGIETYCENWDCSGRKVSLNGSWNNLGLINTNLGPFETWNDRISSVQ